MPGKTSQDLPQRMTSKHDDDDQEEEEEEEEEEEKKEEENDDDDDDDDDDDESDCTSSTQSHFQQIKVTYVFGLRPSNSRALTFKLVQKILHEKKTQSEGV